ncbi:right-handed parallel beta-helix repeat-containing protein [Nonomuraea lactucae]|uniref:right-handed parallel beta-helix repeat-containing protein n=1 Tax=Nonomuraea lactucae TaxID=2249762 RepID=UPI001963C5E1|nr:right-handed parallel beta-helix repeat-containing protein [Nonomuraea lactucae]
MTELFVAPDGDDAGPGTRERPFATLDRARHAARTLSGGIVVQLRGGTHVLAEPLELTEADSGRDGDPIVYQAHGYGTSDQEEVVVSGGRLITGWEERDGAWLADVGDLDTRQLYVDGRRAGRAAIDTLPGDVTMTETGYVTDSDAPLGWRSPADVEFVYRGVYPWTEARCGVAAVSAGDTARDTDRDTDRHTTRDRDTGREADRDAGDADRDAGDTADDTKTGGDFRTDSVITMVQPAFGRARELYNSTWEGQTSRGPGLPTRVENDTAFLTEPGTFVLDRSRPGRHVLRYLPRPGEHPDRTRVVAPVLETLVRATGAHDVSFRGVTFADATWLRPSGPDGFLHYHGSGFYIGGPVQTVAFGEGASVTVPGESITIPACVVFDGVSGVRVEGCRFTRLGATGLGLNGGADVTVRGCDFDTLSAGAVSVTSTRSTLIEDNLVHHVGLDYPGSPGIALLDTSGCTVAHNQVADVPHCGIVAGPGQGTRILRNLTTGTMGALADGGGVYLAGSQGDSYESGAVIRGNVIKDTRTPYNFGLYTDYGAAWVTVEENVVVRADSTAILQVWPPLENVVYRGNFWDADPIGADDPPAGVTYEGNTTLAGEREIDAATATLQGRAGLLRSRPTRTPDGPSPLATAHS